MPQNKLFPTKRSIESTKRHKATVEMPLTDRAGTALQSRVKDQAPLPDFARDGPEIFSADIGTGRELRREQNGQNAV